MEADDEVFSVAKTWLDEDEKVFKKILESKRLDTNLTKNSVAINPQCFGYSFHYKWR